MIRLSVKNEESCDIHFSLDRITEYAGGRAIVITDSKVEKLAERLYKHLSAKPMLFSFPAGEKSKSMRTASKIYDFLLSNRCTRDTVIIAFGGGVAGDVAGFVASTYMRGVRFIQVPTTLLAMVDSSIGGKTGINTKYGKNLIGTICQPSAVFIDSSFLSTLPGEEMKNGMSEIVKIALVLDKGFFSGLETGNLSTDSMIKRACELKAGVVEKDSRENGYRQILNFGHTIGHAIEHASGYRIKHGAAVSIGMCIESGLSVSIGFREHERIVSLIRKLGLPTEIPKSLDRKKIISSLAYDKKTLGNAPRFVLLSEIGQAVYSRIVPDDKIRAAL